MSDEGWTMSGTIEILPLLTTYTYISIKYRGRYL